MAEDGGEGGELCFTTGVCDYEVFDGGDDVDGHGVRGPDSIASRTGPELQIVANCWRPIS